MVRKAIAMKTASWVIVEKATGRAVIEVFSERGRDHILANHGETLKAVPILEYLTGLNRNIKKDQ